MSNSCTLNSQSFRGLSSDDIKFYLNNENKCLVCGKLPGEHPTPSGNAGGSTDLLITKKKKDLFKLWVKIGELQVFTKCDEESDFDDVVDKLLQKFPSLFECTNSDIILKDKNNKEVDGNMNVSSYLKSIARNDSDVEVNDIEDNLLYNFENDSNPLIVHIKEHKNQLILLEEYSKVMELFGYFWQSLLSRLFSISSVKSSVLSQNSKKFV